MGLRRNLQDVPLRIVCLLACLVARPAFSQVDSKGDDSDQRTADSPSIVSKSKAALTYRNIFLAPREESAFFDETERVNFLDQIYGTILISETQDHLDEVRFEPFFRTRKRKPAEIEIGFDQAYLKTRITENLSVIAGKKVELEGVGLFVSPSDLLNENLDLFDTLYQREGVIFSRLNYQFTSAYVGLGFIPNRANDFESGKAWLKAGGSVADFDIQLQATSQREEKATIGIAVSRFWGDSFETHIDARTQARQHDFNSRSESDFGSKKKDEDSQFYVLGGRYVFAAKRTFALEHITNNAGLSREEEKNYFEYVRNKSSSKSNELKSRILGRNFIFGRFQDEMLIPKTLFSLSTVVNLEDQSYVSTIQLRWKPTLIHAIDLSSSFFQGATNTEFGEVPASRSVVLSLQSVL